MQNVIVFGETGAGKSSVINQVLRRSDAPTSNTAAGCTFENTPYEVAINNEDYILYDTAGFNEVSTGTVSSPKAIANLYNLVCSLEDSGGVNLLILVFKCGRLTETTRKNYKLFYAAFCEKKVPIVIVITACETEEPMDKWWGMNEETFKTAGMVFNSHACVCTVRGRKINGDFYVNDDLVALSTLKVETLIRDHCCENGWKKVCHSHNFNSRDTHTHAK
jgi:predicted GTPase